MSWSLQKLGDICTNLDSKRIPITKKDRVKGDIPYYGASGIVDYVDDYLFDEDILLVSEDGANLLARTYPIAFSSTGKVWVNNHAHVLQFRNAESQKFIEFYLNFISLAAYVSGMAQPKLNQKALFSISVPYPPINEQKRIVAILELAFADIEKARVNAEQNLKNARELFESYLQQVFSQRGGEWEDKKWGELCEFVRGPFGGSLKKSMFVDQGYVVYEQKHAIHDHFNQLRYFIDENKFDEMKRFEVKPGDIIMSCSGVTLGRVAVIPNGIPKGIINQALLKLTPKKGVSVHFIKHWLRSKIFQDIIFKHAGGAAIPNVPSAKIMKEIVISLPAIKEQETIVDNIELFLSDYNKLKLIYQQKIDNLEELKKSILQKAFTGELTKETAT